MRHQFYVILCCSLFCSTAWAQGLNPNVDSLEQCLAAPETTDSMKVGVLLELVGHYFGRDFTKSKQYADQSLTLALKSNDQKGVAMASLAASKACIYLSQNDEGMAYVSRAEPLFKNMDDTARLADLTRFKGIFALNSALYEEAISIFEESDRLFAAVNDNAGRAMSIMDIGIAYLYLSTNEKALKYYLEALDLAEMSGDRYAIANVKNSIGQIYYDQGKMKECTDMMRQSLELAEQIDDNILISDCLYYLSRVANQNQQFDAALQLLSKSYIIDSMQRNFRGRIHKDLHFGEIYQNQRNDVKVRFHFNRAYQLCDSIVQKEQTESYVLARLGSMYRQQGDYQQSLKALEKAVTLAQQEQLLDLLYDAYYNLALTYEALGNTDVAFQFHKRYAQVKDEVLNQKREESFNRLQVLYEDEQKKAEISRLTNESTIQKQQIALQEASAAQEKQRSLILIIGIGGLVIVVTVLLMLFRNKAKSNQILSQQKDEIERQHLQKEILLKEIHHRVKNNLQVISSLFNLQSSNISDKDALAAVKEGQNRVKSIALIHQKLYQHENIARVDFDEYITELVAYLRSSFAGKDNALEINVEANAITLDIDTAVPLGLIINELVSNSIKYAFPENNEGTINITLDHEADEQEKLHLTVEDNGIGLPLAFDVKHLESLGLKLVNMLCLQLNGHMNYSNGQGTRFDITVMNTDFRKQVE